MARHLHSATWLRQERSIPSGREYYSTPIAIPAAFQHALNPVTDMLDSLVQHCREQHSLLGSWVATDLAVQKYGAGDGITKHQDYSDDLGIILLLTIQGMAKLQVFNEAGEPWLSKIMRPGGLVMLRGVGLTGGLETRPSHQVGGALGSVERISVGFRCTGEVELPVSV